MDPKAIEEEIERYRRRLRAAIRASGLTVTEVERRLGARPRTLQRVLSGRFELKVRHVVTVLGVLGLDRDEFFRDSAGQQAGGHGMVGVLRAEGYRGRPQVLSEAKASPEEFQQMVDAAVEQVLARFSSEGWARPDGEPEPDPGSHAGMGESPKQDAGTSPPQRAPRGKEPKP